MILLLTFAAFVLVTLFWLCVDEIDRRVNGTYISNPGKPTASTPKLLLLLGLFGFVAVSVFAGTLYAFWILGLT